jgi:hypothetical protein
MFSENLLILLTEELLFINSTDLSSGKNNLASFEAIDLLFSVVAVLNELRLIILFDKVR